MPGGSRARALASTPSLRSAVRITRGRFQAKSDDRDCRRPGERHGRRCSRRRGGGGRRTPTLDDHAPRLYGESSWVNGADVRRSSSSAARPREDAADSFHRGTASESLCRTASTARFTRASPRSKVSTDRCSDSDGSTASSSTSVISGGQAPQTLDGERRPGSRSTRDSAHGSSRSGPGPRARSRGRTCATIARADRTSCRRPLQLDPRAVSNPGTIF